MVDDAQKDGGPPLPPKLNLRKSGILKDFPAKTDTPKADEAPAPAAPTPVTPKPIAASKPWEEKAPEATTPKPIEPKPAAQTPIAAPKPPTTPKPAEVSLEETAVAPKPTIPVAPKPVAAVKPVAPVAPKPVAAVKPAVPVAPKPVAAVKPVAPVAPKPTEEAKPAAAIKPAEEAKPAIEKAPEAPKPVAPVAPKPVAAVKPAVPVAPKPTISKPAVPQPSAAKPTVRAKPVSPIQPAAAAGEDFKSQTMRINLDEKPAAQEAPKPMAAKPIAAKPVARDQIQPKAPATTNVASKTIRIDALQDGDKPAGDPKKETSKIPLDAAKAAPTAPAAPKTMKLTKPATANISVAAKPAVPQPAANAEDKSKTSRISLDAAMTADSAPAPAPVGGKELKTIKLKKPIGAGTVKIKKGPAVGDSPSKTDAIDESAAEAAPSPTRKKTIKVKRPSQKPAITMGGPKIAAKAPAGAPAAGEAPEAAAVAAVGAAPIPMEKPDKPNVFFHIWASLAIVATIVVIIVFYSQALGTNSCLTQYSWNIDWPTINLQGKIQMSDRYR